MRTPAHASGPTRGRFASSPQSVICASCRPSLIGYLIMIAAWPWSALAPLNPLRGLIDFGDFHYQIHTLLVGHIYTMADVPRWYVPVYLLIKLPLVMLVGAALASLLRRCRAARRARRRRAARDRAARLHRRLSRCFAT